MHEDPQIGSQVHVLICVPPGARARTGEIEVDLKRIGQHSHPGLERERACGIKYGIRNFTHRIGQQDFLGETHNENAHTRGEPLDGAVTVRQLFRQCLVAYDGAGDQVREQRDEGRKIDE